MQTEHILNLNSFEKLKVSAEQLWQESPNHFIYLLLNPHRPVAQDHSLHANNLWVSDPSRRIIIMRKDFDWMPEVCPILVQIVSPRERWPFIEIDTVYEQAIQEAGHVNGAYVCGLIASRSQIRHLAQHLVNSLKFPEKNQTCPLFEPLRLERLVDTVSPDWINQWFGPIDAWLWVSADRQPLLWQRVHPPLAAPQTLNPRAIEAQQRVTELQRCLTAWQKMIDILPKHAARIADAALIEAFNQGLSNFEDRLYFALLTLNTTPFWYQHPLAQRTIALAQAQPGMLVQLIENLTISEQQDIGLLNTNALAM